MTIEAATRAYQTQLETLRWAESLGAPQGVLDELEQDLQRARDAMDIAWLNLIP